MNMNVKDFVEFCESGRQPVIKMNDDIHNSSGESFDPGMMGRVVGISMEHDGTYRLLINVNQYEKHNRSVAIHNWRDHSGNLTKSWFDTKYYPDDGIESLYISLKGNLPFEVVDTNYLFSNYLKSKEHNTYTEFLEDTVEELKKQIKELRQKY